jgi:hypothetical protein
VLEEKTDCKDAPEAEAAPKEPATTPNPPAQNNAAQPQKMSVDQMSEQEIDDVLSESSQ